MDIISGYIEANKKKWLKELAGYLAIPSISVPGIAGSKNILEVSDWLVKHFKKIGFKSELIKTPFDPLIYAEYKIPENKFTLLIYCHADVQPVEPIDEWDSPPFKMTVKNGKIYARGVSDSKGHLFAYIKGIEAVLKVEKKLPINIKFIIDCDEEANELSLPWFINRNSKKLAADAVLVGAGAMIAKDTPSICYGYRGLLAAEISVRTLKQNLHSGSFGGALMNAAQALSEILNRFRNKDGKILMTGFYDNVVKSEKSFAGVHCSNSDLLKITGAKGLYYDKKFTLDENLSTRPTFEINGIQSGSDSNGFQYIVPARATAKISFRLVPGQTPNYIFKKLKIFVNKIAPKQSEVKIRKVDWAMPSVVGKNNDFAESLALGLRKVFNKKAVWYREGGAVPVVRDFLKISDKVFMVGFGSSDDNIHGPNEKLNLGDFYKEIEFSSILVKELENNR